MRDKVAAVMKAVFSTIRKNRTIYLLLAFLGILPGLGEYFIVNYPFEPYTHTIALMNVGISRFYSILLSAVTPGVFAAWAIRCLTKNRILDFWVAFVIYFASLAPGRIVNHQLITPYYAHSDLPLASILMFVILACIYRKILRRKNL